MSIPEALLPLAHAHCATCVYSLDGLPIQGRCPECGNDYDNQTLILGAWPYDHFHGDPTFVILSVAAFIMALFLWIVAAIGILGDVILLFAPAPRPPWRAYAVMFLILAGYAAAGFLLFYLSRWLRRRGVRVRINPNLLGKPAYLFHLTPEGYGACRGFRSSPELLSWRPDLEIDLNFRDPIARLRIARLSPVGNTDWSTLVDLSFPATAEQVTALRSHIQTLRTGARSRE